MKAFKGFLDKYLFKITGLVCFLMLFSSFNKTESESKKINPKTFTIIIFRMKFNPENLQVKKGDTVIWINKDFVPHDVTDAINDKWTSKSLNQGEKWQKVIEEDIHYYCSIHKVMKGTITLVK
ncbi:MAG: plastocyanin/azurin family copper-binding protein [Xanthomarina sp.]